MREKLVTDHLQLVLSAAKSVKKTLPPSFDLDDLVCEGNLALARAALTYKPDHPKAAPFANYAWQVIRGAMIEKVRRRHYLENTRPSIDDVREPAARLEIDENIDLERALAHVKEAVRNLPPELRSVIGLHYGGGISLHELGKLLGVCKSSASLLHRRALRELRKAPRIRELRAALKAA
jgi:RNA polymerase sigma factor (sigma-70 family)